MGTEFTEQASKVLLIESICFQVEAHCSAQSTSSKNEFLGVQFSDSNQLGAMLTTFSLTGILLYLLLLISNLKKSLLVKLL